MRRGGRDCGIGARGRLEFFCFILCHTPRATTSHRILSPSLLSFVLRRIGVVVCLVCFCKLDWLRRQPI